MEKENGSQLAEGQPEKEAHSPGFVRPSMLLALGLAFVLHSCATKPKDDLSLCHMTQEKYPTYRLRVPQELLLVLQKAGPQAVKALLCATYLPDFVPQETKPKRIVPQTEENRVAQEADLVPVVEPVATQTSLGKERPVVGFVRPDPVPQDAAIPAWKAKLQADVERIAQEKKVRQDGALLRAAQRKQGTEQN